MPWQNNPGGGRNPWGQGSGGGGGGQQPPNLEDLFKKGQEQLKGALPGGFGGKGLFIIIALFILGWMGTGFYRVDQNEQGVVLRFGEWVETTGPGLHYHLPTPIESVLTPKVTAVNRVDIGFTTATGSRSQRFSDFSRERSMLTGDENIAELEYSVFWRINDAGKFLFNIEAQEMTIKSVAESVMREIIGQTPLQSALTEGRAEIERQALEKTQAVLDSYEAGVYITQVKLSEVDPPASVVDAFRDVQAAQADKERLQNEAEAYQNDIIPRARGEASKMLQEAEAYREQVIARADGEAARFLAVFEAYKEAKDVTRQRIYLETMEQILKGMNKIIIDDKAGSGVVPYLPLPEVKKRQGE